MKKILIILLTVSISFFSCHSDQPGADYLFELKKTEDTHLNFVNELPVEVDLNIFNYLYYYNGGGIAVADFNNDSLIDVYFTSNLGKEKMFLNQGGLTFRDVSDQTQIDGGENGWSTGASVADVNGDGLLDIYLCQVGSYRKLDDNNKLFICTGIDANGVPQYKESARAYGVDFKGFCTQAGFFDYDLDGDLDLYLLNHSVHQNGTFGPRARFLDTVDPVSGDKLFRNEGGHFVDVTREAGIQSSVIGYGLGLAFGDFNLDGYPDIYVGNDFHENDYLYINQGNGTFKESLNEEIQHTSKFTMGVDVADVNNDCFPDIVSLDMLPEDPVILKKSEGEEALNIFRFKLNYGYNHQFAKNCLQVNNGNNTFSEIGRYGGIFATDWSWSPLLFDMDLDGIRDLFVSNGIPKRMNDMDYINFEANDDIKYKIEFDQLTEKDLSVIKKIPEIKVRNKFFLGTPTEQYRDSGDRIRNDQVSYSNSAAYADLDNDGDLDILTNNINDPAFLYENRTTAKSIKIYLEGRGKNKYAIGAKILAYQQGRVQYAEQFQVRGFQSSSIGPAVFATQGAPMDSILVIWPDRTVSRIKDAKGPVLHVVEEAGLPRFDYSLLQKPFSYRFISKEKDFHLEYTHEENEFVEFDREILIPFSTSTDGPALAVGDLNGDSLDDVFVGSAKWMVSGLFFQQADGTFQRVKNADLRTDSTYEEVKAAIIDVNADGANDLVIATGGNEFRENSPFTWPLIYLNDGSGNLRKKADAFTGVSVTAGGLEVFDFTGDGVPDLFIGARAKPWAYGEIPKSYCLANDGTGKFTDVSDQYLPDAGLLGFVKGSSAVDLDQDGDLDIILALEWDGIKALINDGGRFALKTLCNEKGWWNFAYPVDVDNDGDIDILAGNLGLNSRLKIKPDEPVRMYYDDFDDNGTKEQVLSYFVQGKEIPFHNKKELETQMPFIKKKFVYAKDFANASFTEIFPVEKLEHYFEADEFRSMLLINDGQGHFEARPLDEEVQQGDYYAAISKDLNHDGLPDLLLMGNYFDANIMMGRYDSNYGTLLINKGNGRFESTQPGGEPIDGQVKNIRNIRIGGKDYLIIARNNGTLKVVEIGD
ncbi:MAG: VCBS repeat-containing protein [Lewinellaceae bacterium]|nr:VCBS repeat-containing protein [Lewinellaceae bacterium]